jgi:hypothetical protein
MLGMIFGLLFLYWIVRTITCKSSAPVRFIQLFLGFISLALFLILPKQFAFIPFIVAAALLVFSLYKHIKKKEASFRFSTLTGWVALYVVGGAISILTIGFRYHDDQVIGRVILKGHDQSIWTTWKNPTQASSESAWMPAYEVEVQDAKGKTLFSDYLIGDYAGVRAQVILINWPMQLLGFSNLYRLELVHNGYSTAPRHQYFPHYAYALPFSLKLYEKIWTRLFHGNWQIPGVKSTTLESSYFPLRGPKLAASSKEYDLVIGDTGLSARACSSE